LKTISAAFALGACALTLASTGSAAVEFGANDDTGKYLGAGSSAYFSQMAAAGLRQNIMTLKWDPSAPLTIPDKAFLDGSDAGQVRRRKIASFRMLKTAEELLRERFRASTAGRVVELAQRLAERKITPYAAGEQLLAGVVKGT